MIKKKEGGKILEGERKRERLQYSVYGVLYDPSI